MSYEPETTPDVDDEREVSTPANDATDEGLHDDDDSEAGLDDEHPDDDDGDGEDDLVDAEYEGKTYRVPEVLKKALLRDSDYTRKTQAVAEARKAVEALETEYKTRSSEVDKHLAAAKEIAEERVQLAVIRQQIKAMSALDWDKLEQEEPEDAHRLFRQRQLLRDREADLANTLKEKEDGLDSERKRSADAAHATAIRETQAVLKRDIKGWNDDLATKVGEFAVTRLGWHPREVIALTDAKLIKTIHAAFVGDQARRKLSTQRKLEAGDRSAPVSRPAQGGGSPHQRRTTDGSGDKLSTAEWMKREAEREAEKRAPRRR